MAATSYPYRGVDGLGPRHMHAPIAHQHHAVGGPGHPLVVSDEEDRLPTGVEAPEQLEHLERAGRVQRAGRLVRE